MTNELKPCPVPDEWLVELIRAHSDPPLCRVCGEPLSFGAADHTGTKWAHYVQAPIDERTGERPLWHQPTQDHIDASYRYNPQPNSTVVRVAQELLERRQSRPSPAPTVSVEECAVAFAEASQTAHYAGRGCKIVEVGKTALQGHTYDGIAAVHALCVSRLTGAATRSETIEERCYRCWLMVRHDKSPEFPHRTESECIMALRNRVADLEVEAARSLASHPASVAGAERPSFEEVKHAFKAARDGADDSIDYGWTLEETEQAGLRAVMERYGRGAK